jgi:hypothetical protein
MKKIINGMEELNTFLEPLLKGEYVVGAKEIAPNQFEVQWEDRKKYIAHDGSEQLEEVWVTLDQRMIQIQDLTEAHAKNILRMILRQRRDTERAMAQLEQMFQAMGSAEDFGSGVDLDLSAIDENEKPHLH